MGAWLAMWPDVKLRPVFFHHGKRPELQAGLKEKKKNHRDFNIDEPYFSGQTDIIIPKPAFWRDAPYLTNSSGDLG